jgi:signal transduction histidine kinase/CheY-like chemotaxis protein
LGYSRIAIQDRGQGLVLEKELNAFDRLAPGDWIEAEGNMAARAGLPVLSVSRFEVKGRGTAPKPITATEKDLRSFRYIGQLVSADLIVSELGDNSGGIYLNVGPPENPLRVFAPLGGPNVPWTFAGIHEGDKVRVTGLAAVYSPTAPYNRRFQLLVQDPSHVVRLSRGWLVPPWALGSGGALAMIVAFFLWRREGRLRSQREMLRSVYELSEEIIAAGSGTQIARSAASQLPRVFRVSTVRIYLFNRMTKTLDPVPADEHAAGEPIPLEGERRGAEAGIASCFKNRTLLAIPDMAKSPFSTGERKAELRSMLLIPMFTQGEPVGVLQFLHTSVGRNFTPLEKLVAQHLGNQIAVAIKLFEQRSIREQLFRTEKIAAVGRLITGVVNELETPLASIASLSERGAALVDGGETGHILHDIHIEAQRASTIVSRLIAIDQPQASSAQPVDLNRVLRSLMEFRELEWKSRGIHVRNFLRDGPLFIVGADVQIEQAFLSLIVHAEQQLAEAEEKVISIGSNLIAKRVLVEIAYSAGLPEGDPFAPSANDNSPNLNLGVCRSIIEGHEGHIRITSARASESRFEIELPWLPMDAGIEPAQPRPAPNRSHQLTVLLMEPDDRVERQLTNLLGARAYRVVPVRSAEEGLDLTQRMRFDVALCSARVPGLNWVDLIQRTRDKVGAFILLTDGYDAELTAAARSDQYFVLSKPVDENRLDYILDHLVPPGLVDVRASMNA